MHGAMQSYSCHSIIKYLKFMIDSMFTVKIKQRENVYASGKSHINHKYDVNRNEFVFSTRQDIREITNSSQIRHFFF